MIGPGLAALAMQLRARVGAGIWAVVALVALIALLAFAGNWGPTGVTAGRLQANLASSFNSFTIPRSRRRRSPVTSASNPTLMRDAHGHSVVNPL